MGQVTEQEYNNHINEKNLARAEKGKDKETARQKEWMVFTMDVQAVQLFPKTNASALYYSMILKVHNLTFSTWLITSVLLIGGTNVMVSSMLLFYSHHY